MDRRFLTVLGVSLVFALVVSAVFYQMSSKASPGPQKHEAAELRDLVIASHPLQVGMTIQAADLKVVKIPAAQMPKGAFSKAEDVLGRPVISNVLLEEPVLDGRLAQRGAGSGLAPVIPVGMRAVTVRVNDVVGVAGFVLPGMRVDILITGNPPESATRVTRTVLQNITVLSAGTNTQTDAAGKPVQASSVTLLVTPAQAETMTLAGSEARIQLVLRNGADQTTEKTDGTSLVALYGGMGKAKPADDGNARRARPRTPPPAEMPVLRTPPPPPPEQIVSIRGTKKEVETVAPARKLE